MKLTSGFFFSLIQIVLCKCNYKVQFLTCFGFFCVIWSILSFLVKPQSKLKDNIFFNLHRISRRFLKPTLVTAACEICYWNKHSTKFYFSKLCWHFFSLRLSYHFTLTAKLRIIWPVCILEAFQQHKKGLHLFCTCSKLTKKKKISKIVHFVHLVTSLKHVWHTR